MALFIENEIEHARLDDMNLQAVGVAMGRRHAPHQFGKPVDGLVLYSRLRDGLAPQVHDIDVRYHAAGTREVRNGERRAGNVTRQGRAIFPLAAWPLWVAQFTAAG